MCMYTTWSRLVVTFGGGWVTKVGEGGRTMGAFLVVGFRCLRISSEWYLLANRCLSSPHRETLHLVRLLVKDATEDRTRARRAKMHGSCKQHKSRTTERMVSERLKSRVGWLESPRFHSPPHQSHQYYHRRTQTNTGEHSEVPVQVYIYKCIKGFTSRIESCRYTLFSLLLCVIQHI